MTDNTINYLVKGNHYALKVLSENKHDIDTILDQLNICLANITDKPHRFLNPVSIDVYDETNDHIIATLTHERELLDPIENRFN